MPKHSTPKPTSHTQQPPQQAIKLVRFREAVILPGGVVISTAQAGPASSAASNNGGFSFDWTDNGVILSRDGYTVMVPWTNVLVSVLV